MLNKRTFFSDAELNRFFASHSINDESTIYLIKIIIFANPLTKTTEYHIIYSDKAVMKSGQHMRRVGQ